MSIEPLFDPDAFTPEIISGWEPGQRSVIIPVAGCMQTACAVMYRCHLFPAPSIQEDCWEFGFDLQVEYLDGSESSFNTMDRNIAIQYVPDLVQPFVIPAICLCIDALVGDCSPDLIYRVTKGRNLPEKALQKHYIVGERFASLGYRITETGLDSAERMYWLIAR